MVVGGANAKNFTIGGVLADNILHFKKMCLKCILGYSEPFLGENGGGVKYLVIFHRFLDFEKCLTFFFSSKSAPIMV